MYFNHASVMFLRYIKGDQTGDVPEAKLLGSHVFTPAGSSEPITFNVTRGDYAALMKLLSDNLEKAKVSIEYPVLYPLISRNLWVFKESKWLYICYLA